MKKRSSYYYPDGSCVEYVYDTISNITVFKTGSNAGKAMYGEPVFSYFPSTISDENFVALDKLLPDGREIAIVGVDELNRYKKAWYEYTMNPDTDWWVHFENNGFVIPGYGEYERYTRDNGTIAFRTPDGGVTVMGEDFKESNGWLFWYLAGLSVVSAIVIAKRKKKNKKKK